MCMCVGGWGNLLAIKVEYLGVGGGKGKTFQRMLPDKIENIQLKLHFTLTMNKECATDITWDILILKRNSNLTGRAAFVFAKSCSSDLRWSLNEATVEKCSLILQNGVSSGHGSGEGAVWCPWGRTTM